MKKFLLALLIVGVLLSFAAGPALADGPSADHNCAGVVVSSLAGPGFGQAVVTLAQAGVVDNLGFADCGAPPRQNP